MTPVEQIREKIIKLDTAIKEKHPRIEFWMADIHKMLIEQQKDIVQALTDEDIAAIVAGYEHVSKVKIAESAVKSAKSSARLKNTTVDDL